MRRKFSLIMTLSAWLLATGSHWDLVQTFAWGQMIASYSQSMPLAQAIRLTFTADNMCGVCEVVQDARQDPATPGAGTLDRKVQLAFEAVPVVLGAVPEVEEWLDADRLPASLVRHAPPVPPPRAA